MDVIIWTQANGTLAVCIPTGELPIEDVIAKDVPVDVAHRVVDTSFLLLSLDDPFFYALREVNDSIVIDMAAARALTLTHINNGARADVRRRQENTSIGLPNDPDDATWLAALQSKRAAVEAATSLDQLRTYLT